MKFAEGLNFFRPSRRAFLSTSGAALAMPFVSRIGSAKTGVVNIASYGGAINDGFRKAWFDDFEKETGIKVNLGSNAGLALAKLQAMNPNGAEWDIVDLTASEFAIALREDMILPLDTGIVDTSKVVPGYFNDYGVSYGVFLTCTAWDERVVSEAQAPENWSHVWDMNRIPGRRSLNIVKNSGNSIEFALLADGVAMDKLYPCDLDRAFESLSRLGRENISWATTNQEPIQRFISGEVTVGASYIGRVIIARRAGARIGYTTNQGQSSIDFLGVMKNAKNSSEAFELINYIASDGRRAAEFTALTAYPTPNVATSEHLSEFLAPDEVEEFMSILPSNPDLQATTYPINVDFWSENLEATATRFIEWQFS